MDSQAWGQWVIRKSATESAQSAAGQLLDKLQDAVGAWGGSPLACELLYDLIRDARAARAKLGVILTELSVTEPDPATDARAIRRGKDGRR